MAMAVEGHEEEGARVYEVWAFVAIALLLLLLSLIGVVAPLVLELQTL